MTRYFIEAKLGGGEVEFYTEKEVKNSFPSFKTIPNEFVSNGYHYTSTMVGSITMTTGTVVTGDFATLAELESYIQENQ